MAIPFSPERKNISPKQYVIGDRVAVRQPHGIILGEFLSRETNGFARNPMKILVHLLNGAEIDKIVKPSKVRPLA
jgi:hypothetical protein